MSYDQRKNVGKTFENSETKYEYTKTKNEKIETKIKNLMTEHALLKESYDLLRKNHDSSEQRTKQMILSVMKQLAQHYMALDKPNDDNNMIINQVVAKSAFATNHKSTLLESMDKASVMQGGARSDVKSTTESNNRWKRSVFGKFHNKTYFNLDIRLFCSF